MALIGLEGFSRKETEHRFINSSSEVTDVLNAGYAATSAGASGAINIWKDDAGLYRCESMRFFRSIDKKVFYTTQEAEEWAARWLPEIGITAEYTD